MNVKASGKNRRRILVVDDHPDCAESICTLLDIFGQDARAATTGREALAMVESFDPEIVMLDISLPDMSCYEIAQRLRGATGRRRYLAAITGWGQLVDRMRAFAAGFDQHVVKPTDAAALRGILSAVDSLQAC